LENQVVAALVLVLQTKLPPGRRPKKGQKPRMNERKNQFVSYMNVDFFSIGEECFFCEFLPRVFQEREGGQKSKRR